jgi:hypothetical protein
MLTQLLAVFRSQLRGHIDLAKPDAFLQGIHIVLKLRLFGKHVLVVNASRPGCSVLESGSAR